MRFPDGIAAQPDILARSAKALHESLPDVPRPHTGEVIALVGIGASEHAARSAAPVWRKQELCAFAVSASELQDPEPAVADFYVGISESGRSAETVAALSHLSNVARVGVTNCREAPLADVTDYVIGIDSGPDSSVYTTGYTATLQALGMLGESWSGHTTDWSVLPDLASEVLERAEPVVAEISSAFEAARIVDVVASGASSSSAGEGALMLRESARLLTACHETYNYLHGPMEPLDAGTACLIVGDGREIRLAEDTSALGCPTVLVTSRTDVSSAGDLTVLRLPEAPSPLALAVLQILPIQLLGWSIASRRGLAVDGFRYHQDDTKLA
jgi:fructoselysine-6-P-deglycase FrlB-like protein